MHGTHVQIFAADIDWFTRNNFDRSVADVRMTVALGTTVPAETSLGA
jgi:hypothetical protein